MDEPQLERSQNVFQVTEEVKEETSQPPISQGVELSPSFTPSEESNFSQEKPPTEGGIFRILMIFGFIIIFIIIGFLIYQKIAHRGEIKGPVTLTYWGLWEDEAILQPLIEAYQKENPNVKIKYTLQTPKQYRERLEAALKRGDVDIFRFHNTWVPMLKEEMAPLPENILSKKDYETIFYPIVKTDLKLGENYIGIPLMIDGLALYYNEDIFKAAGKQVPRTWDELHETAVSLTVKNVNGEIKTAGIALGTAGNIEHFSDILALMFLQNGVNLTNPSGPEAAEALAYYRMFAEKPNNTWDETQPNSIIAFAQGKVAMIFAPSWEAFIIQAKNPNLKFKTAPVPQLPCVNPSVTCTDLNWASYWVEGVSNKSKNQKEAWKFLKFLSEKDNLVKFYSLAVNSGRAFGEPYSRTDLASTLVEHPIIGAYILQAPYAKSFPLASRTFDNGLNDRLIKYLEDAVNAVSEGASPDGALKTLASGFQQVLSQYGLVAGSIPTK